MNDTVGGVPVAVSYCPLCNSAIAFDRRAGPRVLDFGTSGELYDSDLVMYDRQTRSLWPQLLGQAAIGVLAGTRLGAFPTATVSWRDWRGAHRDGLVLSRRTGSERDYGDNPYPGYDDVRTSPFLFEGKTDGRLSAKARVLALRAGTVAVAISDDLLWRRRVVEVRLAGAAVVVWLAPGTASALEASSVSGGRDVGATGAFDPDLSGRHLRFRPAGDGFTDDQTTSHWDVLGQARAGPLAGQRLRPVEHVDTFWFAWSAFEPASELIS